MKMVLETLIVPFFIVASIYATYAGNTPQYGGTGGGSFSMLDQGRIYAISSWAYGSQYGVRIIDWSSDHQTVSSTTMGDGGYSTTSCASFSLPTNTYINGYRVTYNEFVKYIGFNVSDGSQYHCPSSSGSGYTDTGWKRFPLNAYLSGFSGRDGFTIDAISFQYTYPSPTLYPTMMPTNYPTIYPTNIPTSTPTNEPTLSPTYSPTLFPTNIPTNNPTNSPTKTCITSCEGIPTGNYQSCISCHYFAVCVGADTPRQLECHDNYVWDQISQSCSIQSTTCTENPTTSPSNNPSISPTTPTLIPTLSPTNIPTLSPTYSPTLSPTNSPTLFPTNSPTLFPTNIPTLFPTNIPTISPTYSPTLSPSSRSTLFPTNNPTLFPEGKNIVLSTSSVTSSIVSSSTYNYQERSSNSKYTMFIVIIGCVAIIVFCIIPISLYKICQKKMRGIKTDQTKMNLSDVHYVELKDVSRHETPYNGEMSVRTYTTNSANKQNDMVKKSIEKEDEEVSVEFHVQVTDRKESNQIDKIAKKTEYVQYAINI